MILIKILLVFSLVVSVAIITAAILLALSSRKIKKDLDEEGFYD
jgi:hypothetical protein